MKRISLLLQAFVTCAVLVVVATHVDVHRALDSLSRTRPLYLALAFAANVLAVSASTALWAGLISGRRQTYRHLWRLYVTGLFYNNLGLGTVVGDGFRYGELARAGEDRAPAAVSVLGERIISASALLAMAAGGSLYFAGSRPLIPLIVWSLVIGGAAGALLAWWGTHRLARRFSTISRLTPFTDVARAFRRLGGDPLLVGRAFGWACAVQSCTVLAAMFALRALGVAVSPAACFAVVPLIALAVLTPISVQGIGVREATYVTLFGFVGVARDAALAAAMLSYVTTVALTSIGAIFAVLSLLARSRGTRTEAAATH